MNGLTLCSLEDFIAEIVETTAQEENFFFNLQRWSEYQPFWCVFVCEGKNIYGHYCLGEIDIHEALNCLADTNLKCIITKEYFL